MNQRLRGIINSLHLNEPLKKLADIFGQHFGSNKKGTLIRDLHTIGDSPLAPSLHPNNNRRHLKDWTVILANYSMHTRREDFPVIRRLDLISGLITLACRLCDQESG